MSDVNVASTDQRSARVQEELLDSGLYLGDRQILQHVEWKANGRKEMENARVLQQQIASQDSEERLGFACKGEGQFAELKFRHVFFEFTVEFAIVFPVTLRKYPHPCLQFIVVSLKEDLFTAVQTSKGCSARVSGM
ncbi:hypothetical protein BU15DRAFT_68346 [Melanogaster broomeanus]|nr:hypothetical protein BU15DRAFT_68346 [Melanogaster broomeanus]